MDKILNLLRNAWNTPDLRSKLLFSILILAVFRILAHIPLPGIDFAALKALFAQSQFLGLLNLFSGGALSNFSIIALGLNPYINASIILQLMAMVIPKLEELQKEGEAGMRKIDQYTRLLTVPLAIVQSISIYFILQQQNIISLLPPLQLGLMVLTLTTGAVLLVWLGELITEYGVGNGISILIFAGILSGLPVSLTQLVGARTQSNVFNLILFAVVALLVVGGIVLVNEARREIPVQYARRARGSKQLGGATTFLPLRLNQAGVIPIIFAISLVLIPGTVANFATGLPYPHVAEIAGKVAQIFNQRSATYAITYFLLVVGFTFFYTAVTFNPDNIAENLQKQGGFIPGVRPGKITSEYLNRILTRITLPGGIFLATIAVLPILLQFLFPEIGSVVSLGGTSILIVVSVILETIRSIEAMMVMRGYEQFLD